MPYIDSHAHLDDPQYTQDVEQVIQRATEQQVNTIISIAQDLTSSLKTVQLALTYPALFATVGIHPHEAKTANETSVSALRRLAKQPKVMAIGEIGLDYHYDHSPRDVQRQVFQDLMSLAAELQYPAVIHTREAKVDTLSILNQYKGQVTGVMHCFSGDREMLEMALELGYYISIAGTVTFKKAQELQDLVVRIPLDRLLIETDSPYLAPVPFRGKRNEPAYVIQVAKKIAELKNMDTAQLAKYTVENTQRLFHLPLS